MDFKKILAFNFIIKLKINLFINIFYFDPIIGSRGF